MGYDSSQTINFGDYDDDTGKWSNSITSHNPGMLDPNQANPYASQYIGQNKSLYDHFSDSSSLNPEFYHGLKDTQQANITSSLGNLYASRGLSGSSAEMGGMANAINSNEMSWLNRERSDQRADTQMASGLNQQGYGMTTGVQKEYGDWENAMNQNQLGIYGMEQGFDQSNQKMWFDLLGSFMGAGGSAAGSMAKMGGGGGGGAAGAAFA